MDWCFIVILFYFFKKKEMGKKGMHTCNRTNHIQSRLPQEEETTEAATFDLWAGGYETTWPLIGPCLVFSVSVLRFTC